MPFRAALIQTSPRNRSWLRRLAAC
jgi:hypothetical protein